MAIVARARRRRRGTLRSAPRVVGLAFLALALGVGSWHPTLETPRFCTLSTAAAAAAAIEAEPAEIVAAPAALEQAASAGQRAEQAAPTSRPGLQGTVEASVWPTEVRLLAEPTPAVETDVRRSATRSTSGTRAPPRAV
jgi:hypothetical protein